MVVLQLDPDLLGKMTEPRRFGTLRGEWVEIPVPLTHGTLAKLLDGEAADGEVVRAQLSAKMTVLLMDTSRPS